MCSPASSVGFVPYPASSVGFVPYPPLVQRDVECYVTAAARGLRPTWQRRHGWITLLSHALSVLVIAIPLFWVYTYSANANATKKPTRLTVATAVNESAACVQSFHAV